MLNGIFYSLKAAHNPKLLKWKSGLREIKTKYIYYFGMKLNYPTRLTSPRNKKMAVEENSINETEPTLETISIFYFLSDECKQTFLGGQISRVLYE